MPKKALSSSLKRIVLREKKKNPYLGVRALSELLAKNKDISISKSAVHKILKAKGIKGKKGPKKALSLYKAREIKDCGLFLLRCIDSQIGLFDHLAEELKVYFPRISKDYLEKLIILATLSSFAGRELENKEAFLRLAGIERLSMHKLKYFKQKLSQYKPTIELKPIKKRTKLVSTIKFYFRNGYCGYCDAKMSTFWEGVCGLDYFSLSLPAARERIDEMLKDKLIVIGYTKSFNYLSPLVFNFIKAIDSGLKKIEFLDKKAKVLDEIEVSSNKVNLLVGYYPQILSKGMNFLETGKRFKVFSAEEIGEFLLTNISTEFLQLKENERVILSNVLIKRKIASFPQWGFFTTRDLAKKGVKLSVLAKKYLYLWPYMEKNFLEEMEIIEKSLFNPKKTIDLGEMLPNRLCFNSIYDFSRVGQILSVMFKELIWGWEPKEKKGDFTKAKFYIKISLKGVPAQLKKKINNACFYIDKKRIFLA